MSCLKKTTILGAFHRRRGKNPDYPSAGSPGVCPGSGPEVPDRGGIVRGVKISNAVAGVVECFYKNQPSIIMGIDPFLPLSRQFSCLPWPWFTGWGRSRSGSGKRTSDVVPPHRSKDYNINTLNCLIKNKNKIGLILYNELNLIY
jgi:hypothetical protein